MVNEEHEMYVTVTVGLVGFAYAIGAVGALWANTQLPVTRSLAFARAALWPLWLCGGLEGGLD